MFKKKYLYINILLLICVFFLGVLFKQSIYEEDLELEKSFSDIVLEEKIKSKKAFRKAFKSWDDLLNVEKVALEKYVSVSDKNLFRPERKEWKPPPPPPPPPPVKTSHQASSSKNEVPEEPPKPKEPDLPDPFLYGVVAGKNKRMAVMRGYIRTETKPRFREINVSGVRKKIPLPVRPQPPKLEKKSTIYEVGDYVSGSKIVAINKAVVELQRDSGEKFTVKLFDPSVKKPASPFSRPNRANTRTQPRRGKPWRNSSSKRNLTPLRRGGYPVTAPGSNGRRSFGSVSGRRSLGSVSGR